jgi:hypothetical protein
MITQQVLRHCDNMSGQQVAATLQQRLEVWTSWPLFAWHSGAVCDQHSSRRLLLLPQHAVADDLVPTVQRYAAKTTDLTCTVRLLLQHKPGHIRLLRVTCLSGAKGAGGRNIACFACFDRMSDQ